MYNSSSGIAGQVDPQKPTRLESNDKPTGSDNSALTGNTTLFYPGEISSKNQGTSTSPCKHIESKTVQIDKTRGTSGTQTSQSDMLGDTTSLPSQQNQGKGDKKKSSQNAHANTQPQPSKAMVTPNQPQHFNPETWVQVGHMCNVQPVAVMIILGKIATRIISALGLGQNHIQHTCAEHQSEIMARHQQTRLTKGTTDIIHQITIISHLLQFLL